MKINMHKSILVMTACFMTALLITGCKKGDDNGWAFGKTYIYMPQALQSGGINLTYTVPSGTDSATQNYIVDSTTNTVHIILGVSRSGMQKSGGYSVNVISDPDTVTTAINNGNIQAMALPEKAYSLPKTVSVPANQYATTFYLSISRDQLKAFSGKKVAVAVKIEKPSDYQLNTAYSETIVIIDVDALKL